MIAGASTPVEWVSRRRYVENPNGCRLALSTMAPVSSALALITEQVRERVRREGVDVGTEPQLVDRFVRDEVRAYSERALGGSVPALTDEASAARQIFATLTGFGSLQRFLDDESIEEIWINAPDPAF